MLPNCFYSATNSTIECPLLCWNSGYVTNFFFCQFYRWKLNLYLTTKFEHILILNGNLHFLVNFPLMFLVHFSTGVYIFPTNSYARGSYILRIWNRFPAIHVNFVIWLLILFLVFNLLNFYAVSHQYFHLLLLPLWHLKIPSLSQDYKIEYREFLEQFISEASLSFALGKTVLQKVFLLSSTSWWHILKDLIRFCAHKSPIKVTTSEK